MSGGESGDHPRVLLSLFVLHPRHYVSPSPSRVRSLFPPRGGRTGAGSDTANRRTATDNDALPNVRPSHRGRVRHRVVHARLTNSRDIPASERKSPVIFDNPREGIYVPARLRRSTLSAPRVPTRPPRSSVSIPLDLFRAFVRCERSEESK